MAYVDTDKAESELAASIKKATNLDETAPKQKHVRKCIVYTWDHRTSAVIWNILKVQPILSSEVQTFKALIMVHKIIKDGHPNVIRTDRAFFLERPTPPTPLTVCVTCRSSRTLCTNSTGSRHALIACHQPAAPAAMERSFETTSTSCFTSCDSIGTIQDSMAHLIMKNTSA
ncbi:ANTH domain-containing protein [Dichotomocladium elegans]|nr:ANTH domain-containing protein [Dichotomocladium elegans]